MRSKYKPYSTNVGISQEQESLQLSSFTPERETFSCGFSQQAETKCVNVQLRLEGWSHKSIHPYQTGVWFCFILLYGCSMLYITSEINIKSDLFIFLQVLYVKLLKTVDANHQTIPFFLMAISSCVNSVVFVFYNVTQNHKWHRVNVDMWQTVSERSKRYVKMTWWVCKWTKCCRHWFFWNL